MPGASVASGGTVVPLTVAVTPSGTVMPSIKSGPTGTLVGWLPGHKASPFPCDGMDAHIIDFPTNHSLGSQQIGTTFPNSWPYPWEIPYSDTAGPLQDWTHSMGYVCPSTILSGGAMPSENAVGAVSIDTDCTSMAISDMVYTQSY